MKLARACLIFVVLWPLLGAAGLVVLKEYNLTQATVTRVGITGFDPRDLLHGHYLRFRFDGPDVPDQKPHDYFIPEANAATLDRLLRGHEHKMTIDMRRTASGDMSFDRLYIDGIEWQQYLQQNPNK